MKQILVNELERSLKKYKQTGDWHYLVDIKSYADQMLIRETKDEKGEGNV